MKGFAEVSLLGNLAMKPLISFTSSQKKMAFTVIAVEKSWIDPATKERKRHTRFIPLKAWESKASLLEKFCDKGDRLLLKGYLDTYALPAEHDEKPKSQLCIVVSDITFLSSKQNTDAVEVDQGEVGYFTSLTDEEVDFWNSSAVFRNIEQ